MTSSMSAGRVAAVVAIAAAAVGCYSWRVEPMGPAAVIPAAAEGFVGTPRGQPPSQTVRLTRPDSTQVVLARPFILRDSIQGTVERVRAPGSGTAPPRVPIPIAVRDVARVEVRSRNALQTLGSVFGGMAVLILTLVVIFPGPSSL